MREVWTRSEFVRFERDPPCRFNFIIDSQLQIAEFQLRLHALANCNLRLNANDQELRETLKPKDILHSRAMKWRPNMIYSRGECKTTSC